MSWWRKTFASFQYEDKKFGAVIFLNKFFDKWKTNLLTESWILYKSSTTEYAIAYPSKKWKLFHVSSVLQVFIEILNSIKFNSLGQLNATSTTIKFTERLNWIIIGALIEHFWTEFQVRPYLNLLDGFLSASVVVFFLTFCKATLRQNFNFSIVKQKRIFKNFCIYSF